MRLPFLRPREPAKDRPRAAPVSDEPAAIAAARTRARRRLMGALVLLVVGVLGFPVLFETQPRPLPLDTPIVMPRAEAPTAPAPATARQAAAPAPVLPPVDAGIETPPAAAPASAPAVAAASAPAPARVAASAPAVAAKPAVAAAVPAAAPPAERTAAAPAERTTAAPAPAPPSAPASASHTARYVVQVGAFTDANLLREARQKVERLGFKTYTQVIENEAGKRTRVRVGPYETRGDADAAAAKIKRAGLAANILTL